MKRYLRTCFYYNGLDTAFAFLSLIAITIGCYELVVRAEGITGNPKSLGFLKDVSISGLWLAIGFIVVLNYAMLLQTNPRRWVVCVFLSPVRLLFVGIMLLIKSLPVIFTLIAVVAAASAKDNRKKSKDKKTYKAKERRQFREESKNDLRAAAVFAGSAAVSVYGASRTSGVLESRIRSQDNQYIIVEEKSKAAISPEQSIEAIM